MLGKNSIEFINVKPIARRKPKHRNRQYGGRAIRRMTGMSKNYGVDDLFFMKYRIEDKYSNATAYLQSLSDSVKIKICSFLLDGEKNIIDIWGIFGFGWGLTVSRKLLSLKKNNIISSRRNNKNIYFSIIDNKTINTLGVLGFTNADRD